MWSSKISAMIIACAILLAGLSLGALSTAVAQEPLNAPLAVGTYGNAITPELQYVPSGPAPESHETLTVSTLAPTTTKSVSRL